LKDESIDANRVYACGDIKEIYSKKVFRPVQTVRVNDPNAQ